uniref:PUM-HD domain-containing protein n=1 Tax=Globodera pallida TaxID=36090 RepID=A0A183CDM9_GLOPA
MIPPTESQCKMDTSVQQLQTVRVAFSHQCAKNVCPAAVMWSARMASSSSNRPSHRSELLDAYHNRRAANLQLADLGKHAVAFALDPQGSRFIQQKLGHANPTEKAQLVEALRGHVLTLAQQVYGAYVIGKALKSVDKTSQIEIINELLAQVIPLSLHKYGSWVIRSVLEHCTHKRLVLEQLLANVPILVMDQYGNYVIRHVIEHGLPEDRVRIVRRLHEKERVDAVELRPANHAEAEQQMMHSSVRNSRGGGTMTDEGAPL